MRGFLYRRSCTSGYKLPDPQPNEVACFEQNLMGLPFDASAFSFGAYAEFTLQTSCIFQVEVLSSVIFSLTYPS